MNTDKDIRGYLGLDEQKRLSFFILKNPWRIVKTAISIRFFILILLQFVNINKFHTNGFEIIHQDT